MLTDGMFVFVSPTLDTWLMLPYPGANLSPEEVAFNTIHRYLRAIIEDVFGDLDRLFAVHKTRMSYSWYVQPAISLSCHFLYNGVKKIHGPIAQNRYDE